MGLLHPILSILIGCRPVHCWETSWGCPTGQAMRRTGSSGSSTLVTGQKGLIISVLKPVDGAGLVPTGRQAEDALQVRLWGGRVPQAPQHQSQVKKGLIISVLKPVDGAGLVPAGRQAEDALQVRLWGGRVPQAPQHQSQVKKIGCFLIIAIIIFFFTLKFHADRE